MKDYNLAKMDAHNIVDFITKLSEAMQQVPDLQALLNAMEVMDANALREWQATKTYAKLTGHKTVCVAKDFLPLLLNALQMVHTGKLKRTMSTAIIEDVFLKSWALVDALKRHGSSDQTFVWQDKTHSTPSIVKRLLAEAPALVEPAKRRKFMHEVPHYEEKKANPCV